jgi:long-chain fatty acid transport protein
VQHEVNEDVTVGAAYTYIDLGDAEIRQAGGPLNGSLAGDYSPNEIHTFNLTLIWRFP